MIQVVVQTVLVVVDSIRSLFLDVHAQVGRHRTLVVDRRHLLLLQFISLVDDLLQVQSVDEDVDHRAQYGRAGEYLRG